MKTKNLSQVRSVSHPTTMPTFFSALKMQRLICRNFSQSGYFLAFELLKFATVLEIFHLHVLLCSLVNVFRLWQFFIDRVNPLNKVIHVPSLQSYVMDAATDINKVPLAYQALLFSIYTMAVVSLTGQETIQLLGMTREDALNRFTRGTKLALTRANFLKNYNMTILQALVLYMVCSLF